MKKNIKHCECCRRVMETSSNSLFCEDCQKDFKELEKKFEDNRNKIILFLVSHLINGGSILVKKKV